MVKNDSSVFPVPLLPISSKIFERIMYYNILKYFEDNNLISPKQSGFRPGDSCVHQLLSITHYIFTFFDNNLEERGVFLDISKAFDKVWHNGLIYKLRQNRIKSKLKLLLIDLLKNCHQRLILNGQLSTRTKVNVGIPQGSNLVPLMFLIYINNLPRSLQSNPKLFAVDTSFFTSIQDITTSTVSLNHDLTKISEWAVQWKMNFNLSLPNKPNSYYRFTKLHC